jgi:hypothetical protein
VGISFPSRVPDLRAAPAAEVIGVGEESGAGFGIDGCDKVEVAFVANERSRVGDTHAEKSGLLAPHGLYAVKNKTKT